MRTQALKVIGGTLAALALTTAPPYPGATASADNPADVGAATCGWDPVANDAYYNHCNSNVHVVIRVERHSGLTGYDKCVPPGRTYLGSMSVIAYAHYIGKTC
ncbi:DUF6355 family natural product biosynthesis protein [Nonomuraea zeae]|uniref:Alpha-amylase n=1 Tax=Nonomuraea zeae TaxID=1642303 RepID=A0A5S4GWN9_9ACTN|nr:DUF6355 family natural product biosynthesis protein [Nonomuraea zeae]TMR36921.1 hypothetical protein ETD85_09195 [Nonomuraea zeae]